MTRLQFLGATETVTGSKYLLEHGDFRMLVDCGLFQGPKELRLRNWSPPPVDPPSLDLVVLTHAHLDHTGYLPLLCLRGYAGPVLGTSATADLCGILLPDSGHLQEEDARFANKHRFSKHDPALPLYTEEQARRCLGQLRPVSYDKPVEVHDGVHLRFRQAGHILGASSVEVRLDGRNGKGRTIVFGGDVGPIDQPILPDPAALSACDHLLVESTYGNRDHPPDDPRERLSRIIGETVGRGGTVLIPAFAVGRTQHILFLLRELQEAHRLARDVPIHVDSPMAIHAIRVFMNHTDAQDREMRARVKNGDDPLGLNRVQLHATVQDSKALNDVRYPSIIISASGMATGGRILHHLAYRLGDHRNTILLVGFQAAGTRGRALQDGAKTIRIHGKDVAVRARVETLDGLSAHADRGGIAAWVASAQERPRHVHLVHGEPEAMTGMADVLRERLGLVSHRPKYLEQVEL